MTGLALAVLVFAAADDTKAVTVDSVKVDSVKVKSPDAPSAVSSAPIAGQLWSVVTPRTLGRGGNALEAGIGFPGIYGQYSHGILPTLDIGVRLWVNYGAEGLVNTVLPELKFQALLKYRIMDNGKVSLGANFAPGPLGYFPANRPSVVGFALPIGLNLGIVATSALNVGVTFEIPLWIRFGNNAAAVIPVMTGAGVEYFVTSSLVAFFALRMGPSIFTDGTSAVFTFDGRLGVGWRF